MMLLYYHNIVRGKMKNFVKLILVLLSFIITVTICDNLNSSEFNEYVDYADSKAVYTKTIGDKFNTETDSSLAIDYKDPTATSFKVMPIEKFNDNMIKGVDISSVIEVENNGGVFYNENGNEQDVFEILAESGINYIRIRLWNNPFDSKTGGSFGGGGNDITTALKIATRAKRVGMRICLNFHYSDFWADPANQIVPRAWQGSDFTELEKLIYDYTHSVLKQFEKNGVRPHMVQIGNEINNGICGLDLRGGESEYANFAKLLASGIKAVRDISSKINVCLHLAMEQQYSKIIWFFDKMADYELDYDIIGLSYYSYWHGNLSNLSMAMTELASKFNKKVAIMEYAYGYTDKFNQNTANIYSSQLECVGGYKTSIQGQANYIKDIFNVLNSIKNQYGIGAFYWEPCFLPISGIGWAGLNAYDYLVDNGMYANNLNKVTWANQGLFSYSGRVLPSLTTFNKL